MALLGGSLTAGCRPAAAPPTVSPRPSETTASPLRLATSLHALAAAYTFEAKVTIGGRLATRATGRWVQGAGEFVVESQGTSITYRAVPPRAWVSDEGGGWVELDGGAPLGNPVEAFLAPTTIVVVGGADGAVDLRATYPAAVLGLTGDPVTIDLKLGTDGSVVARYRTETPAGPAVSETLMRPAPGALAVAAP